MSIENFYYKAVSEQHKEEKNFEIKTESKPKSFEQFYTEYKDRLATAPMRKVPLLERLSKVVDLPTNIIEANDLSINNVLLDEDGERHINNFFENISHSDFVRGMIHDRPNTLVQLFNEIGRRRYKNPEDLKVLALNVMERQQEVDKNDKEKYERIQVEPRATDEEYRLGMWKESIESQVRDAVFELQRKGYRPVYSGFDNLSSGSQTVWFEKDQDMNVNEMLNVMKNQFSNDILSKLTSITLDDKIIDGVIEINLTPKNRTMPTEEWKPIWDAIASSFPEREHSSESKKNSNNWRQGVEFREIQDKIRQGINTRISSDLLYVDGKVTKIDPKEYLNSGIDDLEKELRSLMMEEKYKKGDDVRLIQIEIDKIQRELNQKNAKLFEKSNENAG